MIGCEKLDWSGSVAGAVGCGAENGAEDGAGSGSHRNRFEREREILPFPLLSRALCIESDASSA